ncbi:MAG TPA: DNA repair protein RecN [Ruminococcaceae bacterium]|nr:DNA repair protein RecN [Oscillospiraceae bacterium]
MLKSLNIENIAVIEKADIEFSGGLNVLTGETGAGKSIVVDSINAILGERTSKDLVRHGADNANVVARFENINSDVEAMLNDLDITPEEDKSLIISRKISNQGKSNCRINGVPCTVGMLKELGSKLVNIHGQHDSQQLLNSDMHYKFVDMLSNDKAIYEEYKKSFKNLVAVRKQLKKLTADADDKDKQLELLEYQINEISQADIKVGEIEQLKQRKTFLLNAKNIISALNTALSAINGDDDNAGIKSVVESSLADFDSIQDVDGDLKAIYNQCDTVNEQIEVLKDALSNKLYSIDYDESELDSIEERLNLLYNFANKYGETEQDMLNYLANAEKQRNSIVNSDEEIERLSAEYDSALDKTVTAADILSAHRKGLAYKLEQDVQEELLFLDMPKIKFRVNFEKGNLSLNGYDKIEFLISTNPGEPLKPLAKIASGGELSRIMLAIKNIVARYDVIDTLIFDEIDTGVSGRASRKIGLKLKDVSRHTQVICVTHSAQIASVADCHLLIEKRISLASTYTSVKSLDFNGRKRELARIMGGLEITDSLLKSAEELLSEKN